VTSGEPPHVGWRELAYWHGWVHEYSTRVYGPSRRTTWLSWIGEQRIALGSMPTSTTLPRLRAGGGTHVVNCRSAFQTWLSQDLAVERVLFGPANVVHAPMWDFGQSQPPRLWSRAAHFAAAVLTDDAHAGVLIHCQQASSYIPTRVADARFCWRTRCCDSVDAVQRKHSLTSPRIASKRGRSTPTWRVSSAGWRAGHR